MELAMMEIALTLIIGLVAIGIAYFVSRKFEAGTYRVMFGTAAVVAAVLIAQILGLMATKVTQVKTPVKMSASQTLSSSSSWGETRWVEPETRNEKWRGEFEKKIQEREVE